jgi:hypothetical protein
MAFRANASATIGKKGFVVLDPAVLFLTRALAAEDFCGGVPSFAVDSLQKQRKQRGPA